MTTTTTTAHKLKTVQTVGQPFKQARFYIAVCECGWSDTYTAKTPYGAKHGAVRVIGQHVRYQVRFSN